MPLPKPRIDLDELEQTVARVALELDLGAPRESQRSKKLEPRFHQLIDPDRFTYAARSDTRRALPDLSAAEDPDRLAARRDVRADRVELPVAAGNELLHERLESAGRAQRVCELACRFASECLDSETLAESGRCGGFDEHGKVGRRGPVGARFGDRNADLARAHDLVALALNCLQLAP